MPFRPIDEVEVPEETMKALEENKPLEVKSDPESELSKKTPVVEDQSDKKTDKVPYHEDPNVQLYIERQIQKRVGEGNSEWKQRVDRLEERLNKPKEEPKEESKKIGDWTPASDSDAQAARAIISQAKRELLEELKQADSDSRAESDKGDREFGDWLGELRVVGILKNDNDEKEFSRLIVEYGLDNKDSAVKLWGRLGDEIRKAQESGEEEGIKKATEAKIGSSRKTSEPGSKLRTYQERRTQEPNFDAILEREMGRLGH